MRSSEITSDSRKPRLRVFWGDILYDTRLLEGRGEIRIGKDEKNDFVIDSEDRKLGSWRIAQFNRGGLTLRPLPSQEGFYRKGEKTLPLRKWLSDAPTDGVETDSTGNKIVRLRKDDATELQFGDCTFYFDWVDRPDRLPVPNPVRPQSLVSSAIVGSILLLVGMAVSTLPPKPTLKLNRRTISLARSEPRPAPILPPKPEPIAPQAEREAIPAEKTEPVRPTSRRQPRVVSRNRVAQPAPTTEVPPDPFAKSKESDDEWAGVSGSVNDLTAVAKPAARKTGATPAFGELPGGGPLAVETNEERLAATQGQGTGDLKRGRNLANADAGAKRQTGLDRRIIENYVRDHDRQLSQCFSQGKAANGYVKVRFSISATGRVGGVKVIDDTVQSAKATQCIVSEIQGWTFPAASDSKSTTVEFPFTFETR